MFIQTGAVPDATPGGAYFFQLKAYGGSGTYTWSVTAGSLPTGITLASDFLSGTAPGTEGVYPFTVAARDENGAVVTKEFTLAVRRGPLRVATFYLPEASIGHPYVGEQQQSVLLESLGGGVTGHTWSLAAGSQLPAGLTLSPQGLISGTPSGTVGAHPFTVTVTDGAGASASKTLSMVVLPELRAAFGSMLPSAVPNQPYSVTLGATGGFGKDYRFSSQGAMPPGIVVSVVPVTGIPATYRISGTPTVAGTYSFDIEIANGPLRKRQRVQLTVGAPRAPLQIVTDSLAEGQVAVGYSQPLSAEGGSGTGYVWSVNGTALFAAGLALANNIIQGIPVAAGTFEIPLTVTDSLGAAASKTLALTVRPGTAPRIMTSALPGGKAGMSYSTVLNGVGEQPLTWSGTNLAPGLALHAQTGALSGTPATPGTYAMQIRLNDALGRSVVANLRLVVQRAAEQDTGLAFFPVTPCRVMETRADYNFQGHTGTLGPPALAANETRLLRLAASNVCHVPANARAYVLNVTLIPRAQGNSLTLFPGGEQRPEFWTVRALDGSTVANAAIVPAAANGEIQIHSTNEADVVVDISGYFREPGAEPGTLFYPITPCRAVDTRVAYRPMASEFGPPSMSRAETRRIRLAASPDCALPPGVTAYSTTITVVPKTTLPFFALWPSGQTQPNVSSINSFRGRILANSVIVPAGTGGSIEAYAFENTDFIVDINGYFAPDDGQRGLFFHPLVQCRQVPNMALSEQASLVWTLAASSPCGPLPAGVKALALNVTVSPLGNPMPFLTAYPSGSPRPNTSILNAFEGQVVTNSAIIPTGGFGAVEVYAFRPTVATLELSGYFLR